MKITRTDEKKLKELQQRVRDELVQSMTAFLGNPKVTVREWTAYLMGVGRGIILMIDQDVQGASREEIAGYIINDAENALPDGLLRKTFTTEKLIAEIQGGRES